MTIDQVLRRTNANEKRLVTGDTLRNLPDRQILTLHTGERLTIKRGGEWLLEDQNGKVDILPIPALECRHPNQYLMSNGTAIAFKAGRIEIRHAEDGLVSFDPHGVLYVKRGDVLQVVRQFTQSERPALELAV